MKLNTILLHAASHSDGFDIIDIIADTVIDALKMLPLLFLAYLIIEIIEHKAMDKLKRAFSSSRAGVLSGALLGLFPQCGFSVAAANLYSENLISAGVVAAVFISTSDEALPVILSNPSTAKYFILLLAVKFAAALCGGFLLNFIVSALKKSGIAKKDDLSEKEHEHFNIIHSEHTHEHGEHHHCSRCDSNSGIIKNSLLRTLSTLVFIVITVFVFNTAVALTGEESIEHLLESVSVFQPFITALIGLIPSCAVSVILAELFSQGIISFGALVSGLCAGAGAGIAVMFKANPSVKKSIAFTAYIWLFSAVVGALISIAA